jgi:4-hydroxybenzoate polyprenyltransferase
MILMRYGVIQPLFVVNGLNLEFSNLYFIVLVVAVVLTAAAGYIINDYFDVDTDSVNNPEKIIIGKHITANSAYNSYIILNCIALALALYITLKTTSFSIFLIFPITTGVLWFYSTTYKRQFLLGNILVSLLIAIVPLLPAIYEIPLALGKNKEYLEYNGIHLQFIYIWVGIFGLFAFLVNLIREIVKDAEDYIGDKVTGCRTLPVVAGLKITKIIITTLIVLTILMLGGLFIFFLLFNEKAKIDFITLGYFLVFLIIPLVITALLVYKATETKRYSKASCILKIVLFFGIMYACVLWYKII